MAGVVAASAGMALLGLPGAVAGALASLLWDKSRNKPAPPPGLEVVLLLLLVELRSGLSVLAALGQVARALPRHEALSRVSRIAQVDGLLAAVEVAGPDLRPVVAQLARAQKSGASLSGAVRRLLDEHLSADRARRIARARALPVRLMIPVTLLMLPGLVLLLYAPALLAMFYDLTGGLL